MTNVKQSGQAAEVAQIKAHMGVKPVKKGPRSIQIAATGDFNDVVDLPAKLAKLGLNIGDTGMFMSPDEDGNFTRDIEIIIKS